MTEILTALLVLALLVVGAIYLMRYLLSRALRNVVARFRAKGATSSATAITAAELGVVKPGVIDRMFRVRDYKPDALNMLVQADVVKLLEDDRLYLSEQALSDSRLKSFGRIL
jgi:hypothetical protein